MSILSIPCPYVPPLVGAHARDSQAQASIPTADPAAIGAFWDAMTEPGRIYEMRVIRKEKSKDGDALIDSAFVTDRRAFVAAAQRIQPTYAAGVYLTMNPIMPAAAPVAVRDDGTRPRPFNRAATFAGTGATTCDKHILARRRLLIDVDAANKPGTSATADERAAALATRDDIRAYLAGLGWAQPRVTTCSGNGGGILYAIDLPNDDDAKRLVKRVLDALDARFSTPAATVDVANSNAARITRIPGTITAKGTHTPERPWRVASATYPEGAGLVSRAQLDALAAQAPAATHRASPRKSAPAGDGAALPPDDEGAAYAALLANGAPAGQRHHSMLRLVGHYLARGIAPTEIKILLRPWVDRCTPAFDPRELDKVVDDLAAAEARKRRDGDDGSDEGPGGDGPGGDEPGGPPDTAPPSAGDGECAPLTLGAAKEIIAVQRGALADWQAQARAWEALYKNRPLPDTAKDVFVYMHERSGTPLGRTLPEDMPCDVYPDEEDMKARGLSESAYDEGCDVLLSMGLLTRKKKDKRPEAKRGRGKDWYWVYGLNGPTVNALWAQLPTLTEIAPTERQVKAVESRKARLGRAIEEEKPTPEVVRSLKQEAAVARQDRERAVYESRAATFERDNARDQAEAAARERDQALQDAQRIIREHQQPPTIMLGCKGCGTRIDLDTWRCDDCRARERTEAGHSRLDVKLESEAGGCDTVDVPYWLDVKLESDTTAGQRDNLKPCRECGGQMTPGGAACRPCRLGQPATRPLHGVSGTVAHAAAG